MAQLANASDTQAVGRGYEPCQTDRISILMIMIYINDISLK